MADFLIKYGLDILLGAIVAGVTWFFKRHFKLERAYANAERKAFKEQILNEVKADQERTDEYIKSLEKDIESLRIGLLSLQGNLYRDFCERLLEEGHIITFEEFEQEEEDYAAYKKLKGNHRGDALHDAVVTKFNK